MHVDMTKPALIKLFILVILAFIICLPEFFITTRAVLRVNLHCHRYDPCDGLGSGERADEGRGESGMGDLCDSPLVPGGQGGMASEKPLCFMNNTNRKRNRKSTITTSDHADTNADTGWYMCDMDVDFLDLHGNASLSGESVELWMVVQPVNVTLYSHVKHGSILNTPEDQKEEEETVRLLNCCLPGLHTYKSTNHSKCLLQMTNQKILESQTQSQTHPQRNEGWCVYRVLYLALPCVALLLVFTFILSQVEWKKFCCHKKPNVFPARLYKARAHIIDERGLKIKMATTLNGVLPSNRWLNQCLRVPLSNKRPRQ
ncbi:uncharacterized protein LOC124484236 isoform X2 [Hypomesus transpacificus]|uniref:uncharacterized protein LOC124484236 isoform X2 n=1 Tax=Hypomesus transpacificus TaxID=137520 RepID=UPI001F072A29|nr:uncharacterized protein LOC124484236 isoform X2 [Hypomesus transpacificus]